MVRIRKWLIVILLLCISTGVLLLSVYYHQKDIMQGIDVAVSFCDTRNPRTTAMVKDVLDQIESEGFSLRWNSAESDIEKQRKNIQELMKCQPAYLVIVPVKTQGLQDELLKVDTKKTKIILLDRTIDNFKEISILAEVRTDAEWEGKRCAELLKNCLGTQKGSVLEVSGEKGSSIDKMHSIGFRNQLSEYEFLDIAGTVDGNGDRVISRNNVIDYISNHPNEIQAIFASTDEEGIGAIEALEKLGLKGQLPVVSANGISDVKNAIEAGRYYGCVEATPYLGRTLINLIERDMRGQKIVYANIRQGKIYTAENIKEMTGY